MSTSLQESVAAEVFAAQEDTVSRCMPFKRSSASRLFNLSRADLVELDDDALKSFYYTLRYFGSTYFKTMCLCGSGERPRSGAAKRNNYYYQKKQQQKLSGSGSELGIIYSASEMLKKTCIFCHLLKKYERSRMEGSAGVVAAASTSQRGRKLEEAERRRQLLEQHQQYQQQQQQMQLQQQQDGSQEKVRDVINRSVK